MGPKKKESIVRGVGLPVKGVYIDRNLELLETFGTLTFEASRPETLLLLLGSPEKEIVLNALHHIDTFCSQLSDNALQMHEFKIIERILERKLCFTEDLFTRRFAFKIISEILDCNNPRARIDDFSIITQLFDISRGVYLDLPCDGYIVEYAAACLVSLLHEPRICVALENDSEFISYAFFRLGITEDPDVLYQTYLILLKLIRSSTTLNLFCSIQKFPFERVLGDISCNFPDIQMAALHFIGELCDCKHTGQYKRKFICPIFFEQLFQILENEKEILIMHLQVINILKKLMKSEDIAKSFCNDIYPQRFYEFTKQEVENKIVAVGVFCEIAQHISLLEHLHQLGFVSMLTELMPPKCTDITSDICLGIKRLMSHPLSSVKIIQDNPVPCLIKNLALEENEWKTRECAADCLQTLASRNKKLCDSIVEQKFGTVTQNLLNRAYREVTPDCIINVLQILNAIVVHPDLRAKIMDNQLSLSIINAIKINKQSGILVTNLLNTASAYICEEPLQSQFIKHNFSDILLPSLKSPALIVKTAAADFIMLTGKYMRFSEEYIDKNILSTLLLDEKSLSICPTWSAAIEAILRSNPSLKFCIRGRLDISDLIGPNFYLSKKHWKDFKIFRSIIKNEVSPLYPMIIVNFGHVRAISVEVVRVENICPKREIMDSLDVLDEAEEDWIYCRRPIDTDLPKYLTKLKQSLEIRGLMDNQTNLIDITKISHRAKIIADIVCSEMCGNKYGKQSQICSEHVVLNHLNYLKCQLHCSIIPLGRIRFGGYLERSLLFKALSDQIGLPCTLRKNLDGRIMYNEIPIPTQEEHNRCANINLPKRLLNPTHIIDLMDNHGELYPIESPQAYRYLRLM